MSTLADQVGAVTTVLQPLQALIERHVLAAERPHGDDTTVPILAKGKTIKGYIWTYVRDDRPFGGRGPPALSTMPRAIAGTSILRGIFTASTASFRRTPTAATTSCTIPSARRGRSPPPSAGRMPAGGSLSWRIRAPARDGFAFLTTPVPQTNAPQ